MCPFLVGVKLQLFEVGAYRSEFCQDDLRRATLTIAKRLEKSIEVDGGIFEHLL